jgi:hypothetical protein
MVKYFTKGVFIMELLSDMSVKLLKFAVRKNCPLREEVYVRKFGSDAPDRLLFLQKYGYMKKHKLTVTPDGVTKYRGDEWEITFEGKLYFENLIIYNKDLLLKSFYLPIAVSIVTTLITMFVVWLISQI